VDSDSFGRGVSFITRPALPTIEESTCALPSSKEREKAADKTRAAATTKMTKN
jgi:hypothetical protein